MRQWLTVLGLTLPLCLDVFAVSIGVLGEMRLTRAQRIRITLLFLAFEIGMPAVGMAVGTSLTHFTGVTSNLLIDGAPANAVQIHAANLSHASDIVEYSFFGRYIDPILVPVVVGAIGIWILDEALNDDDDDDDDDEAGKLRAMVTATGLSIIGLGILTSVDDLVIGFTLAFHNLPLHEIFTAIVIQAFLAIIVGQFLGWKARTGSRRINVGRITTVSRLAAGGMLVGLAVIALLGPEIITHVIPHLYHYKYIPPLGPSAVASSTPLPESLDQGEAGHDDHYQGGEAADPPHWQDPDQSPPARDGQRRHQPEGQHAPDAHRHRVVVSGGKVRHRDVRQVPQLRQQDHPEAGRGYGPEPRGIGLQPRFVVVIVIGAQHHYGTDQEHHGDSDLHDLVREQAEEATEGNRQHRVHGKRRCRPGEHRARPVPGAQHEARQARIVRQFGYEYRPEHDPDNEQASHVTTSPPGWRRHAGARCARQYARREAVMPSL